MTQKELTIERHFELLAVVEAGYYMLGQWTAEHDKRTPLDRLIDEATGFDKHQREELAVIVQDIRDARYELGFDTSKDDELLAAINAA